MQKDRAPCRRSALKKAIGSCWRKLPFADAPRIVRLWVGSSHWLPVAMNGSCSGSGAENGHSASGPPATTIGRSKAIGCRVCDPARRRPPSLLCNRKQPLVCPTQPKPVIMARPGVWVRDGCGWRKSPETRKNRQNRQKWTGWKAGVVRKDWPVMVWAARSGGWVEDWRWQRMAAHQ